MKKYIKIARPDHWIKNFFILPGTAVALLLTEVSFLEIDVLKLLIGFFSTCMVASANYVINEWLDAPYDKYHPTKKNRPVVTDNVKFKWVMVEYFILAIIGFGLAYVVNKWFLYMSIWLLVMGFFYNVKPFRTKDVVYLDVLSESVNNMIRLLMGWFIVTDSSIPPSSILIGYWMAGAFLMATKRFAEYRMIDNLDIAGLYRRSFRHYTEKKLLASALFYALISTFCLGVFMVKYRIEYVVAMPVMFLLYAYYLAMSLDKDSAVQKPEKLYKERTLMIIVVVLILLLGLMTFIDIDALHVLTSNALIRLEV